MYTTPEQFSAAAKTNFEAQIAALSALTTRAFDSVTKIVDLNLNTAKASFEETSAATKQLLAAKDPQEFFSLTSAQTQPAAEKALAYSRTLAGIASGDIYGTVVQNPFEFGRQSVTRMDKYIHGDHTQLTGKIFIPTSDIKKDNVADYQAELKKILAQ